MLRGVCSGDQKETKRLNYDDEQKYVGPVAKAVSCILNDIAKAYAFEFDRTNSNKKFDGLVKLVYFCASSTL